ncbi:MAG: HisA/HisF-related TIM barrel protein [Candidatus Bathyarchaeota archaeon]|nr:HisA/HisF-related TIM barrel protein [Candidatus Bathyarchaeota archaeon]
MAQTFLLQTRKQASGRRIAVKIIPVIDVMGGRAVHAVKGKRAQYMPLQSRLCNGDCADPKTAAKAFRDCGFTELYLADLDAITAKKQPDTALLGEISQMGLQVMVDAGVSDAKGTQALIKSSVSKVVVGTETLHSLDVVADIVGSIGGRRLVVSLDLMQGKVLSKNEKAAAMDVLALAKELERRGVLQVIVLDLVRVGSGEGVDVALVEKLQRSTGLEVFVGGGVRGMDDLLELDGLGVAGVLLATALHNGEITVDALQNAGLI